MKCPKCSYTTFDYLDTCKKCGTDLRDARTLLQIIAVSPEDRAIVTSPPMGAPVGDAPGGTQGSPASDYGADFGTQGDLGASAQEGEKSDDALLADLNFDESFQGIVEPTSYGGQPKREPENKQTADGGEEELLDLDFGDVFAEKGAEED